MITRITFMPSTFVLLTFVRSTCIFPVPLPHPDPPSRTVPAAPVPATLRKSLRVKVLFTKPPLGRIAGESIDVHWRLYSGWCWSLGSGTMGQKPSPVRKRSKVEEEDTLAIPGGGDRTAGHGRGRGAYRGVVRGARQPLRGHPRGRPVSRHERA